MNTNESGGEVNIAPVELGPIRKITSPHGEAPRVKAALRTVDGFIVQLDFGYENKRADATAQFILDACNNYKSLRAQLKEVEELAATEIRLHDEANNDLTTARQRIVELERECANRQKEVLDGLEKQSELERVNGELVEALQERYDDHDYQKHTLLNKCDCPSWDATRKALAHAQSIQKEKKV